MLGKVLQEKREAKEATQSEAAAATRLKMQHIEALEREDFDAIAAPAYAKGFIKLYAEYLDLDPGPLLADYEDNFMPKNRQPLLGDEDPPPRSQPQPNTDEKTTRSWSMPTLPSLASIEWPFTFSKKLAGSVAGAAVGLLLIVWLVTGLFRGQEPKEEQASSSQTIQAEAPVEVTLFRTHVLMRNPPEPFIDESIGH